MEPTCWTKHAVGTYGVFLIANKAVLLFLTQNMLNSSPSSVSVFLSHLRSTAPLPDTGVRELTVGVKAPDRARDEAVGTTKAWDNDDMQPTATAAVEAMEGRCRRPPTLDF